VLGVAVFVGLGSVAAGTALAPTPLAPIGQVLGAAQVTQITPSPALRAQTVRPMDRPDADAQRDGAPPISTLTGYRWPLPNGRLTLPFGPTPWGSRIVDGRPFHDGVDLATFCGDRIVAAHDGVVLAAGRHFDDLMGWIGDLTPYYRRLDAKGLWMSLPIMVVIDDGNGYRSVYAHFEKIVVKRGQAVQAGELLGYEGATGRASGCHLHYGLFSPQETGRFAMELVVAKRMKLPAAEIARVDPLLVLPERPKPTRPVPQTSASGAQRVETAP
jgi:murein DD-endopeptidase MepM/ murein hydrolase activator NlpD